MKVFLTEFHYKKTYSPTDSLVFAGLFLPSMFYLGITKIRNFLYKKKILKSYKPNVFTVSVGNLTTGGTGKTPITAQIASHFSKNGRKTAILSRGYGGKLPNKDVNVISDGEKINYSAAEAGDEPFWLAKNCPGVCVLTCSSRVKAAKFAQKELGCTVLVLDDGYQHQKLGRDLNILVIDSQKKFSNGCILPMGALRESIAEVERADVIVVTNKHFNDNGAKAYARYLKKKYKKPAFVCSLTPDCIYNLKDESVLCDREKKSPAVIAFSAIAQPEQFYSFLRNYDVVFTKDFPDHHLYTKKDLQELEQLKRLHKADLFITTEKDAVKLKEISGNLEDIYVLKLKPNLDVKMMCDTMSHSQSGEAGELE